MRLAFTKMHGLGNDFVVIDAVRQIFGRDAPLVRRPADRHFGIGCDQLLIVEPPTRADTDFRYLIFNADGGEVEQCGNGARCFARFVHDQGLARKAEIRVETRAGVIVPRLEADGQVTVDMGEPVFDPARIPFVSDSAAVVQPLALDGRVLAVTALSMGNPHVVQIVADVDTAPVTRDGPLLERHERFPQRVNVGYAQICDRHSLRLRVWERGAGETLACGTGACAAAVAGIRRGLLETPVRVLTRGGALTVAWAGLGQPVLMTGPAVTVFRGEIELPDPETSKKDHDES